MPSWSDLPLVKPVLKPRLADLSANFSEYVQIYERHGPFSDSQLRVHQEALRLRKTFKSAAEAACDPQFADAVRAVLREWGVGTRGSDLVNSEVFRAEFRSIAPRLSTLQNLQIEDNTIDLLTVSAELWRLITSITLVTKNGQPVKNKLVSGTKALHHVLPDLVFPIDREYTQTFFGWHNPEFQYNPRDCFEIIFIAVGQTARTAKPSRFVSQGWMSNPTKILDNAIVGFCVRHGLESQTTRYERKKRHEFRKLVESAKKAGIWDAIKAEAKARVEKTGTAH